MLARTKRLTALWLPLAMLSPGLVWLALDRAVWPWDQAWFGSETVTLYETLRHDAVHWPRALVHASSVKPPAAVWVGQFFVPVGMAIGSVDAALRLSIWMTHVAVLVVVFRALVELSAGRKLVAACGTLVAGTAPVFVALSTQYFAEGCQTLAVAWFVLIVSRAPRWTRSRLFAHLASASALAMLAKTTSPAFCAVPGALGLAALLAPTARSPLPDPSPATRGLWVMAILLVALAATWYALNFQGAFHLASTAAFGPIAELYGRRDGFAGSFRDWWLLARDVFFVRPVALVLATLAAAGVVRRLRSGTAADLKAFDVMAAAALLQVAVTLAVFALSPVREPRYLEGLLPLVAVVVGWTVAHGGVTVARVVIAVLAVQLVLVQTTVLGLWPQRPSLLRAGIGIDPALHRVHRDPTAASDLAALVRRTCPPEWNGEYNFVGVDMVDLSGHAATYVAAKERLAARGGWCRYDSIGFASIEAGEYEATSRPYVYWIGVDPAVRPVPGYHEFLNRSAPVVFRRLRRRGALEPEPWDGPPGIRLFRFVKR